MHRLSSLWQSTNFCINTILSRIMLWGKQWLVGLDPCLALKTTWAMISGGVSVQYKNLNHGMPRKIWLSEGAPIPARMAFWLLPQRMSRYLCPIGTQVIRCPSPGTIYPTCNNLASLLRPFSSSMPFQIKWRRAITRHQWCATSRTRPPRIVCRSSISHNLKCYLGQNQVWLCATIRFWKTKAS